MLSFALISIKIGEIWLVSTIMNSQFEQTYSIQGKMNEHVYQQCIKITKKLIGLEMCSEFVQKVDPKRAPGYYDVIKKPMWLNKVMTKLENRSYQNLNGYIDDMNLIWKNCIEYNNEESVIGQIAIFAKERFQRKIKNITQSPQEDFINQLIKVSKGIQLYTQRFYQEIDHMPSNLSKSL